VKEREMKKREREPRLEIAGVGEGLNEEPTKIIPTPSSPSLSTLFPLKSPVWFITVSPITKRVWEELASKWESEISTEKQGISCVPQ
jgi:hypothetical protein